MAIAKKNQGNRNVRVFLAYFGVIVVTLFFVWTRLQNIRIRREIARLNAQGAKVNVENSQLKLKLAQLTSPNRLEQIGMQRYNLKRPVPKQVILLPEP